MLHKPRGAGRSLLLVALILAATALMCAASSVQASSARAATQAPRRIHRAKPELRQNGQVPAGRMRRRIGRALRAALSQRGVPYRSGGSSPAYGFDCSGLVEWAFTHAGIHLPHSSYLLANRGRRVLRRTLRPGDLVFFSRGGHVGIYLGGGRFIHAPRTGTVVSIASLRSSWYRSSYAGARRVLAY